MTEPVGNQTVHVVERVRAKHGKYADGPAMPWPGCSVQPAGTSERHALGTTGTESWNFFGPADFPTSTDNVILHQGLELQVDGQLQVWTDDETNTPHHTEGKLKRWVG
ncbi:hypothetical protein [Nocardia phage KYD2]|nr:hypothetical protein [Nocardia phage KYD2]